MDKKTIDILQELTLEEKARLCSGSDYWHLESVEKLGLMKVMVADGPHGLRKQISEGDNLGINHSIASICFPTACATASSWDINLMHKMGEILGDECLKEKVSILLGPGANIKRSPLCGRNFEYISEDPYHTGKMAAAWIKGVQSKGIGASLKHYAMNNQETRRMTIDVVSDKRAKREIYLKGFEIAVKEAHPRTVMCSYNRVDGTYLSENKSLLTDVLKEEWGYEGAVITDWYACNDRVAGIKAGLDIEMPFNGKKNELKIIEAVKNGTLSIGLLDKVVSKVIDVILKSQENIVDDYSYDIEEHHKFAKTAAANSAVLLKNEGVLPINKKSKLALIGEFVEHPRFQGAGSSIITPYKVDNIRSSLDEKNISYTYAKGYSIKAGKQDKLTINEAVNVAKDADVVVIFAGLTEEYESEGFDRKHIDLPESHNLLIQEVVKVNENVVVVLQNGAPIAMPWINEVRGVLEGYLFGEAGAGAIVDILFGDVNPSGKLAETFPLCIKDNPSYKYFPGNTKTVEYRESIYVGYRYYDSAKKDVLFPFGFGLSYTQFEYSNLIIHKKNELEYQVQVTIQNIGDRAGAEIVQLYVKNNKSKIFKAEKELRAFDKIYLEPNEKKEIIFYLDRNAFTYYNVEISDEHVDSGEYSILIGASSRDIRLCEVVNITTKDDVKVPDYKESAPYYYNLKDEVFAVDNNQFKVIFGRELPPKSRIPKESFDASSSLTDIREKFIGRIIYNTVQKKMKKLISDKGMNGEERNMSMIEAVMREIPLRGFGMLCADKLPEYTVEGIVEILNGKLLKGLKFLIKK